MRPWLPSGAFSKSEEIDFTISWEMSPAGHDSLLTQLRLAGSTRPKCAMVFPISIDITFCPIMCCI